MMALGSEPKFSTVAGGGKGGGDGSGDGGQPQLLYPRGCIIVLSKLDTESFAGNNPGNYRQNEMRQRSQPTFLVTDEHAIRVVSHDGQVRTLAGKCGVAGFADTSSSILPVSSPTLFNGPHGIALLPRPAPEFAHATHSDVIAAAAASVVVCDINNHRLVVSSWKVGNTQTLVRSIKNIT